MEEARRGRREARRRQAKEKGTPMKKMNKAWEEVKVKKKKAIQEKSKKLLEDMKLDELKEECR